MILNQCCPLKQIGKKVSTQTNDQGPYYDNDDIDFIVKEFNVSHAFSVPYTQVTVPDTEVEVEAQPSVLFIKT